MTTRNLGNCCRLKMRDASFLACVIGRKRYRDSDAAFRLGSRLQAILNRWIDDYIRTLVAADADVFTSDALVL